MRYDAVMFKYLYITNPFASPWDIEKHFKVGEIKSYNSYTQIAVADEVAGYSVTPTIEVTVNPWGEEIIKATGANSWIEVFLKLLDQKNVTCLIPVVRNWEESTKYTRAKVEINIESVHTRINFSLQLFASLTLASAVWGILSKENPKMPPLTPEEILQLLEYTHGSKFDLKLTKKINAEILKTMDRDVLYRLLDIIEKLRHSELGSNFKISASTIPHFIFEVSEIYEKLKSWFDENVKVAATEERKEPLFIFSGIVYALAHGFPIPERLVGKMVKEPDKALLYIMLVRVALQEKWEDPVDEVVSVWKVFTVL